MKTVKVLSRLTVAIIPLAALVFSGCESEQVRQHHLYYLEVCRAQTEAATKAYAGNFASNYVNGQLVPTFKTPEEKASYDFMNSQESHDYRVADCMAHEEKTTLEYQRAKHDNYGSGKPHNSGGAIMPVEK
jgi:hypothetical protein